MLRYLPYQITKDKYIRFAIFALLFADIFESSPDKLCRSLWKEIDPICLYTR